MGGLDRLAVGLSSERARCEADSWYFLTRYCKTYDEHDPSQPVKPIPDWSYLQRLVEAILEHKLLAVEKSRQMMVSWVCCGVALWLALFRKASFIAIQSKMEFDAAQLLARIGHMHGELPDFLKDKGLQRPRTFYQFPGTGSVIWAVPQGGEHLRQYTVSWWICDEASFQDDLAAAWRAALPALRKGGRATLVSSAFPGFFCDMVHHRIPGSEAVHVHRVHYTDHPPFRTPEWRALAHAGMTDADWDLEMEINWDSVGGASVYGDVWKPEHWIEPCKVPASWPRMRGIDPGIRNWGTLWIAMDPKGRLVVYRELLLHDDPLPVCAAAVKRLSAGEDYELGSFIDPAGMARQQDGGASIVSQLADRGIHCALWKTDVLAGIHHVRSYLSDRAPDGSLKIAFMSHLGDLRRESRLYRWKADQEGVPRPVKANDHLLDCLRGMLMSRPQAPEVEARRGAPTLQEMMDEEWEEATGAAADTPLDPVLGTEW